MEFWTFYSYVLPAIIMVLGILAYFLHEWDLNRKIRKRGQQHPGE